MAPRNDEEQLRAAWRSLSALDTVEGWRVIQAGRGSRTFAGIRFPDREEGLLIGFNVDLPAARDLPDGRGFAVERLLVQATPAFTSWLALTRRPAASVDLFGVMAADLLATAESAQAATSSDEVRLCARFIERVRSWQKFMERPSDGRLSPDEEVGLFGELSFASDLLDTGMTAAEVMALWIGPQNGLRDFVGEHFAVEVKSTVAVNGFPARIGSLEQLDDTDGVSVSLMAMRLAVQRDGLSLPDIVGVLRGRVGGTSLILLERKLMLAGYSDAHGPYYVRKFAVAEQRAFRVDAEFPRIARSSTPVAVRDAEYVIDLDLVPGAAVPVTEFLKSLLDRETQ